MMIYLPNLRNKCSGPSSVVSPLLAELKNMFLDSDPPATTSILAHICLILSFKLIDKFSMKIMMFTCLEQKVECQVYTPLLCPCWCSCSPPSWSWSWSWWGRRSLSFQQHSLSSLTQEWSHSSKRFNLYDHVSTVSVIGVNSRTNLTCDE